jgi:hypothetical protein
MKALQDKSEKCIFVGYFEDVKGYKLLQPHSNEFIILRDDEFIILRDVKLDENILVYETNSMYVPSLAYKSSLTFVSYSVLILVSSYSSSDDDNEDENPPPPAHLPSNESIEHEPVTTPLLP